MKYKQIKEGCARIAVPEKAVTGTAKEINKQMTRSLPVFYNPVMKFNRDLTAMILNAVPNTKMQIGLPLAGSGVRAVRLLTELKKGKIKSIEINDINSEAVKLIKKNIELNQGSLTCNNIEVSQQDANLFLLESMGFDYIDVDPFGSPIPFLDSAVKRLARLGILAVTATDTAALAGTSADACRRKYNSKPLRNEMMHEIGVRILIKKAQEIGALHEKALIPIFSYFKDHYYRIFFVCEKGKQKVDALLKEHKFLLFNTKTKEFKISNNNSEKGFDDYAGPLFAGRLWNKELLAKLEIDKKNKDAKEIFKFIEIIKKESVYNPFFYDLHRLCKINRLRIPNRDFVIKRLKASGTIFNEHGLKTMLLLKEAIALIKKNKL